MLVPEDLTLALVASSGQLPRAQRRHRV